MKYDPKDWTYGVELEYADVDRGQGRLPPGNVWNTKDYTICNTNGVANDPKGTLWRWGGEINTRPTREVKCQVSVITEINEMLDPPPQITYRCNLHCHVGIPGLREDVEALKKIERYFKRNATHIFRLIQPIPMPTWTKYPNRDALAGAMARYKRRHRSHQLVTGDKAYKRAMNAATPQQFFDAYAPKSGSRVLHHLAIRSAVNLRQMLETDTIEFRHFAGTVNQHEFLTCLSWCREFLIAALHDPNKSPSAVYEELDDPVFPRFVPYVHEMELIYKQTNFHDNTRKRVGQNLKRLQSEGRI